MTLSQFPVYTELVCFIHEDPLYEHKLFIFFPFYFSFPSIFFIIFHNSEFVCPLSVFVLFSLCRCAFSPPWNRYDKIINDAWPIFVNRNKPSYAHFFFLYVKSILRWNICWVFCLKDKFIVGFVGVKASFVIPTITAKTMSNRMCHRESEIGTKNNNSNRR